MPTKSWREDNQDKMRKYRRDHYYRNREHYLAEAKKAKTIRRTEILATDDRFRKYINEHPTKTCRKCGAEQPTIDFPIHSSGGRRYPKSECSECSSQRRVHRKRSTSEELKRRKRESNAHRRKDPLYRPLFIVRDCKKSDKKYGRHCDLDVEFVEDLISSGCLYCGNQSGMMVLDRIDNSKGHTKDNVNPACLRCNSIRSDMQYEVWLKLVPAIRALQEAGAFGDWRLYRKQKCRERSL